MAYSAGIWQCCDFEIFKIIKYMCIYHEMWYLHMENIKYIICKGVGRGMSPCTVTKYELLSFWTHDFWLSARSRHPRQQGSWGLHGAHLGPVGPRRASCWPHKACYRGRYMLRINMSMEMKNTTRIFQSNSVLLRGKSCWHIWQPGFIYAISRMMYTLDYMFHTVYIYYLISHWCCICYGSYSIKLHVVMWRNVTEVSNHLVQCEHRWTKHRFYMCNQCNIDKIVCYLPLCYTNTGLQCFVIYSHFFNYCFCIRHDDN